MKLADKQCDYREFLARSQDRERQRRIIRELFQNSEMPVKMFNHLTRLLNSQQRRDSRETGFQFSVAQ